MDAQTKRFQLLTLTLLVVLSLLFLSSPRAEEPLVEPPLPAPPGQPEIPAHFIDPPHEVDHEHGPTSLQGVPLPCPEDAHLSDDGSSCVKYDENPIKRFDGKLIAGKVSRDEAHEILDRVKYDLIKIRGVSSMRITEEGFLVTVRPGGDALAVPKEIEGIPVRVEMDDVKIPQSHSYFNYYTPFRGGYSLVDESTSPTVIGVATGFALSRGAPWILFPTHLLQKILPGSVSTPLCRATPPTCPLSTPMNLCSPNDYTDTMFQQQSAPLGPATRVGWAVRWDRHQISWGPGFSPSADVAAAWADNNLVNDGSLPVDSVIDGYGLLQGAANPVPNEPITVFTAGVASAYLGVHVKHGFVADGFETDCDGFLSGPSHDFTACVNTGVCSDYGLQHQPRQVRIEMTGAPSGCSYPGDSGSIWLNAAGKVIGSVSWGQTLSPCSAGGTRSDYHQIRLGFDSWLDKDATNLQAVAMFPSMTVTSGSTAYIWYAIKNFGPNLADDVRIGYGDVYPPLGLSVYYWNSQGEFNMPEDIPAGQTRNFILGLNRATALNFTRYPIHVWGKNAVFDARRPGENTFAVGWTNTLKPNPLLGWLSTGGSSDRILHIPGASGTNYATYFIWNNTNITANLKISATAPGLPLTLYTCELNQQGACVTWPPVDTVSIPANATAWIWIAAVGNGTPIPETVNSFYTNRITATVKENAAGSATLGELGFHVKTN